MKDRFYSICMHMQEIIIHQGSTVTLCQLLNANDARKTPKKGMPTSGKTAVRSNSQMSRFALRTTERRTVIETRQCPMRHRRQLQSGPCDLQIANRKPQIAKRAHSFIAARTSSQLTNILLIPPDEKITHR